MNNLNDRASQIRRLQISVLAQIDALKDLLSHFNSAYGVDDLSAAAALEFTSRRFAQESSYAASKFDGQSGRTDAVLSDLKDQLQNLASLRLANGRQVLPKDRQNALVEAYDDLVSCIKKYRSGLTEPNSNTNVEIPSEKTAPLRVRVAKETLHIFDHSTHVGTLTAPSIDRIREATVEILENAFSVLGHSHNIDPRFVPSCKPFLKHLNTPLSELSAEALGFNWQIFCELISQNKDSFPSSIYLQLDQVSKSTNVILSQFEEWRAYLTQQTVVELEDSQLEDLLISTEEIIDDIFAAPNVADEEIGDRLIELTAPVTAGLVRSDAITIPLIDSLSNLFAQISTVTVERSPWITGTAEEIQDFLGKSFKQGLIFYALYMLTKYAPKFSNMPLFKFMADAHALALKQFPWAKDTILK